MKKGISKIFTQFREAGRPVRLLMGVTFLEGIVLSIWYLFFNFYILGMGFDREILGWVNSAASIATLVLGIPIGLLSDRIGRKSVRWELCSVKKRRYQPVCKAFGLYRHCRLRPGAGKQRIHTGPPGAHHLPRARWPATRFICTSQKQLITWWADYLPLRLYPLMRWGKWTESLDATLWKARSVPVPHWQFRIAVLWAPMMI